MTLASPDPTGSKSNLVADEPAARIVEFFERLDAQSMDLVDDFYAAECRFVDPLGELRGRQELRAYYAKLYADVTEIAFEFDPIVGSAHSFAAPWTMKLRAKLGRGKLITVPGISRIQFDPAGQALFHQDYFDLGAFVYENVPVLGSMVRMVKKRLAGHG